MIKTVSMMIKTKFSFFEMAIKHMFVNPFRPAQSQFGVSPKGLNAINMRALIGKFIAAMLNPKMLRITNINQTMVAQPSE